MTLALPCCPNCGAPFQPSKINVHVQSATVTFGGKTVHVNPTGARILKALTQRSFLTHDALIFAVWTSSNLEEPTDAMNTLKVHIGKVRRAVAPLGILILNVWGHGFRLTHGEPPQ
jgi:DNA-binding response OmpR family regulator